MMLNTMKENVTVNVSGAVLASGVGTEQRFLDGDRLEWLLTPSSTNASGGVPLPIDQARFALLNGGAELHLESDGSLPSMNPRVAASGSALVLPPRAIGFVVLQGAAASQCL